MNSDLVRTVDDSTFDALVHAAELPVLVEFGATWCPPCRTMEPLVADLAAAWQGRVQVVYCDADHSPRTATRLQVRSVPTFVVLLRGRVCTQAVGSMPRARLEQLFAAGHAAGAALPGG